MQLLCRAGHLSGVGCDLSWDFVIFWSSKQMLQCHRVLLACLPLLGNCPNQAGLLTHLQQSSSLVPKSQIVRAVQSGSDWSMPKTGLTSSKGQGLSSSLCLPSPGFSGFSSWISRCSGLKQTLSGWMVPCGCLCSNLLKFPSLKSSLWGLQGGSAFFQSALRNAGCWLLINNLSDTSALCSDPGCLLGQHCSPWNSLLCWGEGRMKAKHQPYSLHSLKG